MADLFISYARADRSRVAPLVAALEAEGWSVWWDPAIVPGQEFDRLISEELDRARAVIVVWTPASVESAWVRGEAREGRDRHVLAPVRFDNARPPIDMRAIHTTDLDGWNEDRNSGEFRQVVRAVHALMSEGGDRRPSADAQTLHAGALAAGTATLRGPAGFRRWTRGRTLWAGLALAGVAVSVAGVWITLGILSPPPPARVLVAPLDPLSDEPEVRALARQVSSEVVDVLGANQTEAVLGASPTGGAGRTVDPTPGVGFVIGGSARRQNGRTEVSVRLEDARTHDVLWSKDFARADSEIADLQSEVAAQLANMARLAVFARVSQPPLKDDVTLAALLDAQDSIGAASPDAWARALTRAQQVVAHAPDFAFGHVVLSLASNEAAQQIGPGDRSAALMATARREAQRALELDPRDAGGYVAKLVLVPDTDYRGVEAVLSQGLQHADRPALAYAVLNGAEGRLLGDVGRTTAALPFLQLAVSIDPLSPFRSRQLIEAYADLGQQSAANDLLAQARRRWPSHFAIHKAELYVTGFYGSAQERADLFAGAQAPAAIAADPDFAVFRTFYRASQAPSAVSAAQAARVITNANLHGGFSTHIAIMMLASLGQVDAAFDLAAHYTGETWFLFTPPTRAMRKDPRFMPLAAKLGLVAYWRASGRWPDFCQAPDRPYDCKVEAAKATAGLAKAAGVSGGAAAAQPASAHKVAAVTQTVH